jgi:hypothetical protein
MSERSDFTAGHLKPLNAKANGHRAVATASRRYIPSTKIMFVLAVR